MIPAPAPKGVYAAVSTPVDAGCKIDADLLLDHCRWLLENGCAGLAPLGTTGEANSLATSQRRELIETMAEGGLPMDKTIVGTGSTSFNDAIELSEIALDAGANGLLMLPPFYYKSPTEEGLFRFFARVAEALGGKSPRIFLYHFPQMSAVPFTLSLVRRLRKSIPGVFVGMKDSSGDFENTKMFVEAFPGFEAFSGSEVFTAANLEIGGWGCISATTNVTAPIVAAWLTEADPDARAELNLKVNALRDVIASVNNVSGTKGALSVFRACPSWARTLPPNVDLGKAEASKLASALDDIADLSKYFRKR